MDERRARAWTATGVGLGLALLALRYWLEVGSLAVSVPYWDQWDFFDPLFDGKGWLDHFLWQHGPHRQGLGGLVYGALYPATGWSARAEAFVAWAAIAVAAALGLRLKLRAVAPLAAGDLWFGFAFFSVSSYSLFLGAQNLAHGPLPVLLVLAATSIAATAAAVQGWARFAALTAVGIVALFTGFGLAFAPPLAAFLALELVARRRRREPLLPLAVSLAALVAAGALFFRGYRWLPASDCLEGTAPAVGVQLEFLGAMSARAWGLYGAGAHRWTGLRLAAGIALLALVVAASCHAAVSLLRRPAAERARWRAILLLCGFTAFFTLLTAPGRSCLGLTAALASRYTLYAAPGMVGLYLWLHGLDGARRRVAISALLLLLAVKELRSSGDLSAALVLHERKTAWVDCYRRRGDVDRCDRKAQIEIYPASRRGAARVEEKLQFLEAHRLSLFAAAHGEP